MRLVKFLLKCYNYSLIKVYKMGDKTLLYCIKHNKGVLLSYDSKAGTLTLEENNVTLQDVKFRVSLGL